MNQRIDAWSLLEKLFWQDLLLVLGVIVLAKLISFVIRRMILRFAEKGSPRRRLLILRFIPLARLLIGLGAAAVIVPIVAEPTIRNVVTLFAGLALVLAYTLKDYGSSLAAALTIGLENTYQPGDWIEIDGSYGEVRTIGTRATRIVTADDTEVIIPNSHLWNTSVFNATSGNRSLLCVADFYLHPDHDSSAVRKILEETAKGSSYRKPDSPLSVVVREKPWGTHYRLKAYVNESREQFSLITDLTIRGKEALRSGGIRFAQAAFAETKP